jgi:RNA polymerase-binding transcription factor DksA
MKSVIARGGTTWPLIRAVKEADEQGAAEPREGQAFRDATSEETFRERMRASLLALKEQTLGELALHDDELRELVKAVQASDLADSSSGDVERLILRSLGSAEAHRLRLIESALARLQHGHYGVCVRCGRTIPRERLEAIPYATLCKDCKSADERRNR